MMSDSKSYSERRKKKIVQEGLRRLRNKPGWDVEAFRSGDPEQGLRQLDQKIRSHQTYGDAEHCQGCEEVRQDSGDDTALCDQHLARAMGLGE